MLKKKTNNLTSPPSIVNGVSTTSCSITGNSTTATTAWKGGYVTDNFHSYYLDANMVKRYK